MYSPGRIPANPKTDAQHIPLTAPKKKSKPKQAQNLVESREKVASSSPKLARNGKIIIIIASRINMIYTLTLSDKFYPLIKTTIQVTEANPLTANG